MITGAAKSAVRADSTLSNLIIATSCAILFHLAGCSGGETTATETTTTAPATVTQPPVATVPSAPTTVTATGGTDKVTIAWSAVSGATGYNLYWSTTDGISTTNGNVIATTATPYIQRGLAPSATYYYIVTAQNSAGEGAASPQASAATSALDGATPYDTYCVRCHGELAVSTVTNAESSEIKAAMQSIAAMSTLTLTDQQIATISAALMYNQ